MDKLMQRFTGRAKEITNIPCKKHSIRFKIWILADHGYILLWMFHAKGDGKLDGPTGLTLNGSKKGCQQLKQWSVISQYLLILIL